MRIAAAVVVVFLVLVGAGPDSASVIGVAAASPLSILVTPASDTIASPACPDASRCTLRKAIETANVDVTASAVTITFNTTVFPSATPTTVSIATTPLPPVTRADLAIDGSGAGVRILSAAAGAPDGLVLSGARSRVSGISIARFAGTCLKLSGADVVVGGERATGHGNDFGDCGTAIRTEGTNTRVQGNRVGFGADGLSVAAVQLGIVVAGSNSVVGDDGLGPGYQNRVGNAQVAVVVGGTGTSPVTGIKIISNIFGQAVDGRAAPVGVAVRLLSPVTSAQVASNSVSNAQTGIALQGSVGGPSAQGVRIAANTFSQIGHLSVDLNEDNQTNPNDVGDGDAGANDLTNTPVLTAAEIQSASTVAISGTYSSLALARTYRIEFFASSTGDPSGSGEAQRYLGFTDVTTDGTGNASFNVTLSAAVAIGEVASATATDLTLSETSELSANVTATNTASTLDATKSPTLNAVTEDAGAPSGAVGTLISQLVDFASPSGQVDNVTDPNTGAVLGIAITAVNSSNGTWLYSTNDGASWSALGAVSDAAARLLAADAGTRLYFQPNADYNGTLADAITFRAWDQTSGSNGTLADTSANGGTTAFSTATDTASLVVNAVNDVPTITNLSSDSLAYSCLLYTSDAADE